AKAKISRYSALRHDSGAHLVAPDAPGSGFAAQSRLYLDRAGVVSDLVLKAARSRARFESKNFYEVHHSSRRRHGRLPDRVSGRQDAVASGAHAEHGLAGAAWRVRHRARDSRRLSAG